MPFLLKKQTNCRKTPRTKAKYAQVAKASAQEYKPADKLIAAKSKSDMKPIMKGEPQFSLT